MDNITTISLDLWGTLVGQNPKFAEKRLGLLREISNKTDSEIQQTVHFIKKKYDNSAVSSESVFDLLKTLLEIPLSIQEIMGHYYVVFGQNPPFLLEKDINTVLKHARKKCTLHLISNTLMIKGRVLVETLNNVYDGIFDHFEALTFSDEVGVAKPDAAIFSIAYNFMNQVPKSTVLHIGDNIRTDISGATHFGFQAALVDFDKNKSVREILSSHDLI